MKTIDDEAQKNAAGEIYTYIAIPINSLKQSTNNVTQTVQPIEIGQNMILNVLQHDVTNERIQTFTLTDEFIENVAENKQQGLVIGNEVNLRHTVMEQNNYPNKCDVATTSSSNDKNFVCDNCGHKSKTRWSYKKHLAIHKQKPYKCLECSASYNYESNLILHKIVHAVNVTNCPVCEKSFNRKASLKNHLTFHEIEETYTCPDCLAEFDIEESYNKHMLSHKNGSYSKPLKNPRTCPVCDEQFDNQSEYKEHRAFHTEVNKLMKIKKTSVRQQKSPSKSFSCEICNKSFSKYCLLLRHIRIHTGEKPFACHYCGRAFAQRGSLHVHLKIHSGLKPYQCTICPAKFSQKCNLRAHVMKTHAHSKTSEKTYNCQMCACVFRKISSLNAHAARFHKGDKETSNIADLMQQINQLENQMNNKSSPALNGPIEIPKKNDISNTSESFVRLADKSGDAPMQHFVVKQKKTAEGVFYVCSYCDKEFKKPSDLLRHIRVHTKQKPFKCKLCNHRFTLKSTLISHVKSHATIRSYECSVCQKIFTSNTSLSSHSRVHDKSSTQRFMCNTCKVVVSGSKAKHVKSHKLEAEKMLNNLNIQIELKQPMVETSTGLVPVISSKLKALSDSANANKPRLHRCHCGAGFFQIKHLQRHMLIHTNERKFKCNVCPKSFNTSYTLKEHQKLVHNAERRYACKICDKRFVSNSVLKRHITVHNPTKPYICPYCRKRFRTVIHCKKHIKLHKKDILINALEANDASKVDSNFVPEESLQDNLFVNTLPDGTYNLDLSFESLTNSADLVDSSDLLSETSELKKNNEDESISQILYTDKDSGVIVSTPLDISQTEVESQNKLDPQLLLTSTALPSYAESTKNIIIDHLETVEDTISSLPQESSTVFLNFDDFQLATSSYYNHYSNIKNFDQLLGDISEIQDNNILLATDPTLTELTDSQLDTSNLEGLTPFAFNSNLSLNNVTLSTTNSFPNVVLSNVAEDAPDLSQAQLPDLPYELNKIPREEEPEELLITEKDNEVLSNFLESSSNSQSIIPNTDEAIFGNVDFSCSSCKKFLSNVEDLVNHYCIAITPEDTVIHSHRLPTYEESIKAEKKVENLFKCTQCNKNFTSENSLQKHAGFHKQKKNIVSNVCIFCEKGFKKKSDLARHIRIHTGEKPFKCDKCQNSFTLKSTLEAHKKTHNPELHRKFDCAVCSSRFSTKSSLKVHMLVHTGVKPYSCMICPEKFRTTGHRKSHMRNHLNNNKGFKQSKATKVTNMLQSVITQSQNPNQVYEEVLLLNNTVPLQENKELTLQSQHSLFPNESVQVNNLLLQQLNDVLLNDGAEKIPPFIQVDINNYGEITNVKSIGDIQESFKPPASPKNLEPTYSNYPLIERNFECNICFKRYTTKSVLTKHKKVVHKLNHCTRCKIEFTQKKELEEHLKLHNSIRPYSCSFCENSFSLMKNLITHMKRIHNAHAVF